MKSPLLRWWIVTLGVSGGFLLLDILSGPGVAFPVTFSIPVLLASWHLGLVPGIALSITLPGLRLLAFSWPQAQVAPLLGLCNALIFTAVFILLAVMARKIRSQQEEVRVLKGILPICSYCKHIRTSSNSWVQLESYISKHSEAQFSHGLCDECLAKHYPEYSESPDQPSPGG